MFIDLVLSMNIIALLLIIVLVVVVAYKVLIKKVRPEITYTPFDYITGMTKEEFKEEEEDFKHDDH